MAKMNNALQSTLRADCRNAKDTMGWALVFWIIAITLDAKKLMTN
jgi:hypothetical protein